MIRFLILKRHWAQQLGYSITCSCTHFGVVNFRTYMLD